MNFINEKKKGKKRKKLERFCVRLIKLYTSLYPRGIERTQRSRCPSICECMYDTLGFHASASGYWCRGLHHSSIVLINTAKELGGLWAWAHVSLRVVLLCIEVPMYHVEFASRVDVSSGNPESTRLFYPYNTLNRKFSIRTMRYRSRISIWYIPANAAAAAFFISNDGIMVGNVINVNKNKFSSNFSINF